MNRTANLPTNAHTAPSPRAGRRVLILAAAALLVLAVAGCSSSSKTSANTSTSVAATNPPTSGTSPVKAVVANRFAGSWFAHDVGVKIDSDGSGTMTWRTGRTCGQDPPPCDTVGPKEIVPGGKATFRITATAATTSTGQILSTADAAQVPKGPLTARLDAAHDLLYLTPSAAANDRLCGPQAAAGACGA